MWLLLKIAAFAALGGFLFGYDLGLIGGALLEIRKDMHITADTTVEFIVGAAKFGAFFGTFLGGALMLRYGRRKAIALNGIFFTLGPLVMAFAVQPWMLVCGRLVIGLGIGGSATVVPAYLAELAPAKHRGAMVQVYEMMLCLGMLASSLIDWGLQGVPYNWRWMVGLPLVPGALLAASLCVLPESPRWLVMRGRLDEALALLSTLQRGDFANSALPKVGSTKDATHPRTIQEAEEELLWLWDAVEKDKQAAWDRRQRLSSQSSQAMPAAENDDGDAASQPTSFEPLLPLSTVSVDKLGVITSTNNSKQNWAGKYVKNMLANGYEACHQGNMSDDTAFLLAKGSSHAKQSQQYMPGEEPSLMHTLWHMLRDVVHVAKGPESKAFWIAVCLAFFDQASASTAIINFAPSLLARMGSVPDRQAMLLSSYIGITKVIGVGIALVTVDHLGRRTLLIWGAYSSAVALFLAMAAVLLKSVAFLLFALCLFIFCFSLSWAGLYWVVVSELFSMAVKSPASSAATSLLFLTGAVVNLVFLSISSAGGPYSFSIFGLLSAAGGIYVWYALPETKGRSLLEVQALISKRGQLRNVELSTLS